MCRSAMPALALLMLLGACSTRPGPAVVTDLPNLPPAAEDMAPCPVVAPPLVDDCPDQPGEECVSFATAVRLAAEAGAALEICAKRHQALVNWINR